MFQFFATSIHPNSFLQGKINAVEPTSPPKYFLRRIDIHHRQITTECRRQSAAFHDAAHGKRFRPLHGFHEYFGIDGKAIGFGKFTSHHQRIGLRKKYQRVVNHRLPTVFQIVIAQAAIAGHVHGQDQNVARSFQFGVNTRFNHWHRHTHFRNGLNLFQNLFGKTRLPGCDLKLGCTGNAIHCLMKSFQHRLIRSVHSNKYSHTQHNTHHSKYSAQPMFASILPTN